MSAAGPPQGANQAPSEGSAAAKPQAWGYRSRRTPLVAGGFLAGALLGALPPMQALSQRWTCVGSGGEWIAAAQACEYRPINPFVVPARPHAREQNLLNEEER